MKIEAQQLRIADVVFVPGRGSGEIVRREEDGADVRVWFRGEEIASEDADEDEGPPPSAVFDAAAIVEIQRPGSLFEANDRPAIVQRIVDAFRPAGWVFHAGVGGKADHLHDPPDLVRVEFRGHQVLLFLREPAGSATTWSEWGDVVGTLDAFAADFTGKVRELELASQRAWRKHTGEPVTMTVERVEFPTGIEERFAVLRKRLAAAGWVHHLAKPGTRLQSIVDPTDTLRLAFDGTSFGVETRVLGDYGLSRRWEPHAFMWSDLRALLVADFEAGIRELLELAKTEAAKRASIEARTFVPTSERKPVPEGAEPVIVRYSRDGGVLLCGPTYPYKDTIKALHSPYSFRFSRKLPADCAWYVPGTRGTFEPRSRIDNLVAALRMRGVPAVAQYVEPIQGADQAPVEATIEAIVTQTGLLSATHPEREALATAMLMAVRAGIGPELRTWLSRMGKARAELGTELLAAARGRVAMETGKWPPAPERGSRYVEAEFRGVLESLAFEPNVLETLELADRWAWEIETVAGAGAVQRFFSADDLGRDARSSFQRIVEDVRRRRTHGKGRKVPTDPTLARAGRERVVSSMAGYRARMQATLDPSLYDRRTAPQAVVDRLCKVSSFATKMVLQDVHGFVFTHPSDVARLCEGMTKLADHTQKVTSGKLAIAAAPVAVEPVPVEPAGVGLGRPADRKRQAEKLRAIAAKLTADADKTIGAERLENTHRRASMAANIRKRAFSDQVIARALNLAADEVERGQLIYIARLSSRPQIDDLERALNRARWEREHQTGVKLDEVEPQPADVEYARYRSLVVTKTQLRDLMTHADKKIDASSRKRLRPLAEGEDQVLELVGNDVELIRTVATRVRDANAANVPRSAEAVFEDLRASDRLARLGVRDTASLQAALREYLGCCRGNVKRQKEDPIAARKRELAFANIPGFVPTPRPLGERLVAAAAIQPGMLVLEPSAGSGAIAEVIREQHPDAKLHVIERQYALRELLQAQGFNLIANDFTQFDPARTRYHRIVMNPPFEQRQDTHHIGHALDLLAPGGRLVAIASASLASRSDKDTTALRERVEQLGGTIEKLPEGSFAASGTDVHTVLVLVDAPAIEKRERPTLVVVPPPVVEPAEADCGCEHAPAIVEAKPKREPPKRPGWATPAMSDEDVAAIGALNQIKAKWKTFDEGRPPAGKDQPWQGIPNTACLEPVPGDDGLTVCVPGQAKPRPIGACPPLPGKPEGGGKMAMCETGEPIEWFGGQHYIPEIRAEVANRLARRRAAAPITKPAIGELPAVDDFPGQAELLATLVPSGIVVEFEHPVRPIEVEIGAPHRRSPSGSLLSLRSENQRLVDEETLIATVIVNKPIELAAFVAGLGTQWIAYTGPLAISTLRHLANALRDAEVDATGITLDHFRSGRFDDETIYWVEGTDGTALIEPINAAGRAPGVVAVREFAAAKLPRLEIQVPENWSLADTIVVVALVNGKPSWLAWQPSTRRYRRKAGSKPWTEPESPPTLADGREYDLDAEATRVLLRASDDAPRGTIFRAAGPWLGHLYPSDFGKHMAFDAPTGGQLDVDALRADYARWLAEGEAQPTKVNETGAKLAKQRVAWATKWIAAQDKPAKPETPKKPKAAKAPKPVPTPPVRLAVVPGDAEHEREQEQPMKTTSDTKKVSKKAAAKKSSAKKAANGKKASKKAPEPQRTSKKASKKASKKKAAVAEPQRTSKKKASKKAPVAALAKPIEKVAAPSVKLAAKAGPCISDDTCPPELESWRNRLKRGDRVRFRKNSRIATALGLDTSRVFEIRCTACRDGQRFAILNLGIGSGNDVAIPVGQFAVVDRRPEMPQDIRVCVSKLAKMGGPISAATREIVAHYAQES